MSGKEIPQFIHRFVVGQTDAVIYAGEDKNKHNVGRIANNYLFHGRTYEPETGLYYYRHRYYFPRLGRFLQQDPMGYVDSMNMYQAFNQNPVNFVDPMGLLVEVPGVQKNFVESMNTMIYRDPSCLKTTGRIMEGTGNMVIGTAYFAWDAYVAYLWPAYYYQTREISRVSLNLTDPQRDIFVVGMRVRTAKEAAEELSVIVPTSKFIGEYSANVYLGYVDENVRDTFVGTESRAYCETNLVPMVVLVYTTGKGVGGYCRMRYYQKVGNRVININECQSTIVFEIEKTQMAEITGKGLTAEPKFIPREILRKVELLRSGKEIHVKTVQEARLILKQMPELRPAVHEGRMPNPDNSLSGFIDAKGTYRGDLINKKAITDPIHPGINNYLHKNYPHYNIRLHDGIKAAIIIIDEVL